MHFVPLKSPLLEVVTASMVIAQQRSDTMYADDHPFEAMIEQIAREDEARAGARADTPPLMVKSLSFEDPTLDARVLHRRIVEGGRKAQRQLEEMFKSFARTTERIAAMPRVADVRQSQEDKARWLNGIIHRFDQSIAAGKLTAEQVAIVENRIHHTARRLGLV
jgi:hypothetical protein